MVKEVQSLKAEVQSLKGEVHSLREEVAQLKGAMQPEMLRAIQPFMEQIRRDMQDMYMGAGSALDRYKEGQRDAMELGSRMRGPTERTPTMQPQSWHSQQLRAHSLPSSGTCSPTVHMWPAMDGSQPSQLPGFSLPP